MNTRGLQEPRQSKFRELLVIAEGYKRESISVVYVYKTVKF